jgi:hypothetical protein
MFFGNNVGDRSFWRCLRPGLYAHTAQALAAGRYPLHSLTRVGAVEPLRAWLVPLLGAEPQLLFLDEK